MSPVASSADFSNNTHWASSRWTQKRTKLCPVARACTALAAALVLIQWLRGRRRGSRTPGAPRAKLQRSGALCGEGAAAKRAIVAALAFIQWICPAAGAWRGVLWDVRPAPPAEVDTPKGTSVRAAQPQRHPNATRKPLAQRAPLGNVVVPPRRLWYCHVAGSFCGAARARLRRLPNRKLAHEAGDGGVPP